MKKDKDNDNKKNNNNTHVVKKFIILCYEFDAHKR